MKVVMLIGSIGAILLGLPYIFRVFGETEAEVVKWGMASVCTGIALLFLSVGMGRSKKRINKVVLALGYTVLALLQAAPIYFWIAFHGVGTSDGTPPSTFVAHWGYSIPHLALLIASLMTLFYLVRGGPVEGEF